MQWKPKKARIAIVTSHEIDFKIKAIIREKVII